LKVASTARSREGLGIAAQSPERRDGKHGEEREEGESQTGSHPEEDALEQRPRSPESERIGRDEVAEKAWQVELQGETEDASGGAPYYREEQDLAKVEKETLARAEAEAFGGGDRIEATGEKGAHALSHTDASDEEGEQRSEAEKVAEPFETVPNAVLGFDIGGDPNTAVVLLRRLSQVAHQFLELAGAGIGGQAIEPLVLDSAAKPLQAGGGEIGSAHQDPRTDLEGAQGVSRLVEEKTAYGEGLGSHLDRIAHAYLEL
jgi:hypothetical protein